jgi:hypothetical protein
MTLARAGVEEGDVLTLICLTSLKPVPKPPQALATTHEEGKATNPVTFDLKNPYLIALILIVVVLIAAIGAFYVMIPSSSSNFDFVLRGNWDTNGISFCYSSETVLVSVVLISGTNPPPVTLSVQQIPQIFSSVTFSVTTATPSFDSYVTIQENRNGLSTSQLDYLTIVGEGGGITRTVSLPILSEVACP